MPEIQMYPSAELPAAIKYQILSFVRIQWSWVFTGKDRFWDYTRKSTHPENVVMVENDVLISHAEINRRMLDIAGQPRLVYGLSAVFTYPAFRHEGHARTVVEEATATIRERDADLAILFCDVDLIDFYERCGWEYLPAARLLYGERTETRPIDDGVGMFLFVSERGKSLREYIERYPIYIGPHMW